MIAIQDLIKLDDALFQIPREFRADMRVPAKVFADEKLLKSIIADRSLWQLINVATLPGIIHSAMAMPDIHEGYGFPIGGVAAMALDQGAVICPGGIGYDINCGVRMLLLEGIMFHDLKPYLDDLATALYKAIPSGVGQGGFISLTDAQLEAILQGGSPYMLELGYGLPGDLEFCEEGGVMTDAWANLVSEKAKERGRDQLGTLGSGNHFLEIQKVAQVFDQKTAQFLGLSPDAVTIMIHCGSRGLGHQVCTDYVRAMVPLMKQWGFELPDRELVCAPFGQDMAQRYFSAMKAAANFAWANRHMIGHAARKACRQVLGNSVSVRTVYDISHNIGKMETHMVNQKPIDVVMHRKGATRSFGPGRPEVPALYRDIGQPVFVPGTMGTASYVMVGTHESMERSFGSCCHGAGRVMSRMQAKKTTTMHALRKELEQQGIIVRCDSPQGLVEEAPCAYKDIEEVVASIATNKLANKVAQLKPLAVIKGG